MRQEESYYVNNLLVLILIKKQMDKGHIRLDREDSLGTIRDRPGIAGDRAGIARDRPGIGREKWHNW